MVTVDASGDPLLEKGYQSLRIISNLQLKYFGQKKQKLYVIRFITRETITMEDEYLLQRLDVLWMDRLRAT